MKSIAYAPSPEIRLFRSSSLASSNAPYLILGAKNHITTGIPSDDRLLSYSFTETIQKIGNRFSFSVVTGTDVTGNLFSIIQKFDIVKIHENNQTPSFIGIIHSKNHSVRMTESGPQRSITFSGESLGGLLSRYLISMDINIPGVADANFETTKLTLQLASLNGGKLDVQNFLKTTWNAFKDLSVRGSVVSNTGISKIIDAHMGKDIFITGDIKIHYPIAQAFYRQGSNSITDIWTSILPPPVYELFDVLDPESGQSKIVCRETPFDPDVWQIIPHYKINPLNLTSYDLTESDDEVYTVFFSYLEGSVLSVEQSQAITMWGNKGSPTVCIDKTKFQRYGYRPLICSFRGFDMTYNKDTNAISTVLDAFKELNSRLQKWYSNLDDMLSGTIIIGNDIRDGKNPKAGTIVSFLNGEFYVRESEHTWSYGSMPSIKLSVIRGAEYQNGNFFGKIQNVGVSRSEIEP